MTELHELRHAIGEYWKGDKLLFSSTAHNINKDNYNYAVAFNKDKTRASYFFRSKDIFFKWEEATSKGNNAVDLIFYNISEGERKILEVIKYKPVEINTYW